MLKVEYKEYLGWENCISLSNGDIELIVTSEVGPRIVFYGFPGEANHMKIFPDQAGLTGGEEWRIYGGHRLWHSPEAKPRSYEAENSPCKVEITNKGVILTSPLDSYSKMEKELAISLEDSGTTVTIDHKISNCNAWDAEFSVWALTVMAPGGRLIIPQPVSGPELLPNRSITLWTYTRLNDPRVHWLDRYIFLDQDENISYDKEPEGRRFESIPFKIGLLVPAGWAAYVNHGQMFVKYFENIEGLDYPDFGRCGFEAYTNQDMLEIESLSPLATVKPDESISHREKWQLFDGVDKPESEEDVDDRILGLLALGK